jgi:hypothetical protein
MNRGLKIVIPVFLILAMAIVAGCASSAPVPTAPPRTSMPAPAPSPAVPQMLKDSSGVAESSVGGAGDILPGADRKTLPNPWKAWLR